MTNFNFILSVIIFISSIQAWSYEASEGNVTATFGPFISKTRFDASKTDIKTPIMGGVGLIVNGDVNDKGSLEIAMFHFNKVFLREQEGLYVAEQAQLIHITMGYRYWMSHYVSASLAFSTSYTIDDYRSVSNEFPAGQDIDTSARDVNNYGFDLAVQAELWSHDRYAAVLDARYSLSVTSKGHEYGDHYGIVLGLRYLIQEKIKPADEKSKENL